MRRRWVPLAAGAVVLLLLASGCGALFGVHVDAVVLVAATIGTATLAAVVTARAVAHTLLARRLRRLSRPTVIAATPVRSLPGAGPLVAGLVRPSVYCGEDVAQQLSPGEQAAVLLHERCHQIRHDPVRLVWLDALHGLLGRVPAVRRHVDRARADLEIRADHYALCHGASRQDLAGALLTLPGLTIPGTASFGEATHYRLAALLDGVPARPRRRRGWFIVAGVLGASLASAICAPMLSGTHSALMFAARCLTGACGLAG